MAAVAKANQGLEREAAAGQVLRNDDALKLVKDSRRRSSTNPWMCR